MAFLASVASAFDLPVDQEAFRVLVAREVTIGTAMKDAEDRLIALGLQCKSVTGGWTNNVSDKLNFCFVLTSPARLRRDAGEWRCFLWAAKLQRYARLSGSSGRDEL